MSDVLTQKEIHEAVELLHDCLHTLLSIEKGMKDLTAALVQPMLTEEQLQQAAEDGREHA